MEIFTRTAPGAAEPLRFAAAELSEYLRRMLPGPGALSVTLEVREEEEPGCDSFSVALGPEGGRITGSSGRAALLGVYDCLRRLGCRFLAPGRANELVPVIGPGSLALRYEHRAPFAHRGVCIEGADSRENIRDFIDWLPKLGMNSFFFQFKTPYAFLARWYHHERNPYAAPEPYEIADAERDTAELERELARRGLLLHKVGHGWTGEALGYDSVGWLPDGRPLPPEKRPLAALVNGRRELTGGVPLNTNLCLSNPAAVEAFASLVLAYARAHPETAYLHIWLADSFNNVCECPACRAATPSDQYAALLNELDRRLTAEGLATRLVFLLYQELLWPPVKERLKNPARFALMFAPISRTFEKSYEPGGPAAPLPPYRRNRISLPGSLEENLAFLRAWQERFQGDGFVFDYPLGRAHYGDFGYLHISRVIAGDIRRLKELGLNGCLSCQELRAGMPNCLPNYVMGRLLFDEEADLETVAEEYFSAAYGSRSGEARALLERFSALSCCDYLNGKGPRQNAAVAQRMEELEKLCRSALPGLREMKEGEDSLRQGFWARLEQHTETVLRLAGALRCLAAGQRAQARESWRELERFVFQSEPAFQPWLDAYRFLDVTANYTLFRQVLESGDGA